MNTRETVHLTHSGVLTLREAAEVLRCSKAHLSNIVNGKVSGLPALPVLRIGRRLLIRRDALDRWLLSVER
jgi:excisionase family DNA binding protein